MPQVPLVTQMRSLHNLKQHSVSGGRSVNILIAGLPENTKNYEKALTHFPVSFCTDLTPPDLSVYDKLLLPGGGDIHPARFGQPDLGSRSVDPALDDVQFSLLNMFVRAGKPVLGICRGLQIINVYFGGDIIQDLPTSRTHQYAGCDQLHPVQNAPGSVLHRLYGDACTVNSAHHQGCGRIGRHLTVTQTAPDGVAEALEHTARPILGVQWHPERTGLAGYRPDIADGMKLIQYFLTQM